MSTRKRKFLRYPTHSPVGTRPKTPTTEYWGLVGPRRTFSFLLTEVPNVPSHPGLGELIGRGLLPGYWVCGVFPRMVVGEEAG